MTDRVTSVEPLLSPIRTRLEAATPGPWEAKTGAYSSEGIDYSGGYIPDVCNEYHDGDGYHAPLTEEDAVFIASAPTDMARLLAAVESVLSECDDMDTAAMENVGLPDFRAVRIRSAITAALGGARKDV